MFIPGAISSERLEFIGRELEKYAFPVEGVNDQDIVDALGLKQPLESITFKAPQLLVYYYGLTHPRFVLSFDKGMGKTIAYLSILYDTREQKGKTIILCGRNARLAQRREIIRHLDDWRFRWTWVEGNKGQRKKQWESDNDVFITTYDTLLADLGLRSKSTGRICPSWVDHEDTAIACDEWHKKLRTKGSAVHNMFKKLPNKRMIFSSGSAGGKGVHSLWAVLHICDKVKFSAYWPYVMRHSIVEETHFGKKLSGCKDIIRWRKEVSSNIYHRKKDLKDYPPKTRQALEVEMEPWQKQMHDSLKRELMAELPDGAYFAAPNVLAMTSKLRQFLCCPKVLSPELGYGAGLAGILEDAQLSELTHFVVSVPFVTVIPFVEQFFAENGYRVFTLSGSEKLTAEQMAYRIEQWTKFGGVIIQSILFAESYELPAARIMYMLGYMHSPEQNEQAEDRIHRDIRVTPHPVDIYYIKHRFAYDEDIAQAMSETADNVHVLMHRPMKEYLE